MDRSSVALDPKCQIQTVMFGDQRPQKGRVEKQVLQEIAKLVSRAQFTTGAIYIDALVPIVKLRWKSLDVDISFQNFYALENTAILQKYVEWDERLPALGFWVKKWAKKLDICTKTNGSLSSYTFILLTIFYLQRTSPRILPYLHSEFLKNTNLKQEPGYYHKEVQKNWSKNTETVAELFLGFLDFYAKFDFAHAVIQIRRKTHRTRRNKELGAPIVVRDCVQKKINIAAHVQQSMMNRIITYFRLSAVEVRNWMGGMDMQDSSLKELFNVFPATI